MEKHRSSNKNLLFVALLFVITQVAITYSQPPIAVADGNAAGTTGGAGGSSVTVTTAIDFKSACESSSPQIVVVKGDLGNVGQIKVGSNKTIVGFDTTAGYTGNILLAGVSNVIIQNLRIRNPSGVGTSDGVEATTGSSKIFVTKCTFLDCKDGSFDMKRGSDLITVSWCRFMYVTISGHNFPNLIGHADNNGTQDKGKLRVTMHHNWYDKGCASRMPRVRFGTVHVYNNYYGHASTYAIGTGVESKIRVESCEFENIKTAWNDMSGMSNGAQIGWNDLKMTGTNTPTYAPNKWPVFTPSYSFTADPVDNVKSLVTDPVYGAGNRLARGGSSLVNRTLSTSVSGHPGFHLNSTRNSLIIQTATFKNVKVELFSLDGRNVVSKMIRGEGNRGNVELQLNELTNGVYFMRLDFNGAVRNAQVNIR